MKSHFEILLVEDSNVFAEWITREVAKSRFYCTIKRAKSFSEAKELLSKTYEQFDIIVLDLNLPDSGGLDTLRSMLNVQSTTPIIVLTSDESESSAVQAAELGAQDYLVKGKKAGAELRKAMQFVITREKTVSELRSRIDVLAKVAVLDPLTGVFNRGYLDDQIQKHWDLFVATEAACAFILVDLDHFGDVNNEFGHPIGDQILQWFAAALASRLRQQDIVCRYGGEEFCVVLPLASERDAWRLAEKMRTTMEENSFKTPKGNVAITASFGIASFTPNMNQAEDLLDLVDAALYKAKESRNCCVPATEVRPLESII